MNGHAGDRDHENSRDAIDDRESRLSEHANSELESVNQHLFSRFRCSAEAVANLYRGGVESDAKQLWSLFNLAAGSTTDIYREALGVSRKSYEVGLKVGARARNREILSWAKTTKKNFIRRDELMALLGGEQVQPRFHKAVHCSKRANAAVRDSANFELFKNVLGVRGRHSLFDESMFVSPSSRKRYPDDGSIPTSVSPRNKKRRVTNMADEDF